MAKIIGGQPLYDYEMKTYIPHSRMPKIAVIGGGHGQSAVLRGLKKFTDRLTAIVAVSDDGGGSGTLREDLGILPPGDIRNCITALCDTEPILEKLMRFRFQIGSLSGQSFGNLFIAAMTGISESFTEAVSRTCDILSVRGSVLPVTSENVHLEATFENGRVTLGESSIYLDKKLNGCRIRSVRLVPEHPQALPEATEAILDADIVLIGPGSLYTSIIPNFLVDGITEAVRTTKAKRVFIMNVMTQDGETEGYTGADHLRALFDHSADGIVDYVIANSAHPEQAVLDAYRAEDSEPIRLCRDEVEAMGIRVIEKPLTAQSKLARHDPDLLAEAIMALYRDLCSQ